MHPMQAQQRRAATAAASSSAAFVPRPAAPCRGAIGAAQPALAGHQQPASAAARRPAIDGRRRRAHFVSNAVAAAKEAAAGGAFSRGAHWEVHKFGGTCMATAARIRDVAALMVKDIPDQRVVVVSAMGSAPGQPVKVTDLILNMIKRAAAKDAAFLLDLAALQDKHVETAKGLLGDGSPECAAFLAHLTEDIGNLRAMLQAISIAGMTTDAFADYVVGHGELWSARLFAATSRQQGCDAVFMDTRDVLVVTPTSDGTSVDLDEPASNAKLDAWFAAHGRHRLVVPPASSRATRRGRPRRCGATAPTSRPPSWARCSARPPSPSGRTWTASTRPTRARCRRPSACPP